MTNWTDIPNFTPELQKKWETKDFSAEETKEWMEFGLEPEEADFADWLKKKYNITAEEFLDDDNIEELRGRYKKELEERSEEVGEEEIQNIQDWLEQKYPKEQRENIKELYINKENIEGKLDLSDFPNLEKIFLSSFVDENKLEVNDEEKYNIVKLKNAQKFLEEYLEKNYPGKQKGEITGTLRIDGKNLEGDLKIEGFSELERLDCDTNKLTSLEVINCPKLKTFYCYSNQLSDLRLDDLPQLELLSCHSNDLPRQDLTIFSKFVNLKTLKIGNDNKEKIEKGIYNRFYGSLEPLKGLNKLSELSISNTDLDSGLEFLSDSIGALDHEVISDESNKYNFGVNKIREQLAPYGNSISVCKEWKRRGFNSEEVKQWKEAGLNENEYDFATYLKRQKGYNNIAEIKAENIENSREDFNSWIKIAQNYLGNYFPEERRKITNLNISYKSLEGILDLSDFVNLETLDCSNNKLTGINGLGSKLTSFRCSTNQLTNLEINNCKELTDFRCLYNQLTELKINNCPKLNTIDCDTNKLENLDVGDLSSLTLLDCRNNLLTNITLPEETANLKTLYLQSNKFSKNKDFSFLTSFANLESLDLGGSEQFALYGNNISTWREWKNRDLSDQEIRKIKEAGVGIYDYKFADYLKEKNYYKNSSASRKDLEKRCNEYRQVQTWVDFNYPKGERRSEETKLDISNKGLEGPLSLEGFHNLKNLNLSNNKITELILKDCENLESLDFSDNKLAEINLKNNKNLVSFYCQNNQLTKLDLDDCSNVEKVNCYNNEIAEINLDNCLNIKELNCYFNKFESLNISNLIKLESLSCNDNFLEEFKFNPLNSEKLTNLNLKNNRFSKQDLSIFSNFTKLKQLLIGNDNKEKIEKGEYNRFCGSLNYLKELTDLEILDISNTDVNQVSIENLPEKIREIHYSTAERPKTELKDIKEKLDSFFAKKRLNEMYPDKKVKVLDNLYSERLKGHLDLSEYEELEELRCDNNQLTSLDVSNNTKLKRLNCSNNKLKEINLDKNVELKELKCGSNELGRLILSNNASLEEVHCSNNELNNLNISKNTKLKKLDCSDNRLTKLDLQGLSDLTELNCSNNKLTELSGIEKENVKLTKLNISGDDNNLSEQKVIELSKLPNLIEFEEKEGRWRENKAQEWLDQNYPKERRGEERELDISGEGLTGELKLGDFKKLQYLTCSNNKLTSINLEGCEELVGVDCRKNKLEELKLDQNCNLKELQASDNEFKKVTNVFSKIGDETKDRYSAATLNYFDVNNNNISGEDAKLESFKKFKKLKILSIGSSDKDKKNKFSGSLVEGLEGLEELVEININKTDVKFSSKNKQTNSSESDENKKNIEEDLKKGSIFKSLEKIFCPSNTERYKEIFDGYHDEEGQFFNVKAWRESKLSGEIEIKSLVRLPSLSENKSRHDIKKISESNDDVRVNYSGGKEIYPSKEAEFDWKVDSKEDLSLGKLPLRLVCIDDQGVKVKRRIDCDAKRYAILSYTWNGEADKGIKWSPESVQKRLTPGGGKSLSKATKVLRTLKNKHSLDIKYLWMDQMCIDQDNPKEKQHEIPKMREYYGNSSVTLVSIHADIGKEVMKKLLNSFAKESGLIYPNEIIKNSLPILEKIISSEWFSRSWTFQEGFLSKQTIFMFDDFLIDGRFMALIWKLRQFSEAHYVECGSMKELCRDKIATPVGWVYYEESGTDEKKGYGVGDKASLRLNEALWAVKDRGRSIPQDGIYSIIGLLPYGDKVKVNYEKDPEAVLREVMLTATEYGYGEPLAWYGSGNKKLGLCWMPDVDVIVGSGNVRGSIDVRKASKEKLEFTSDKGISIKASEFVVSEKGSGIYKLEREEIVDGGLWRREVLVKGEGNELKKPVKLILSGTKEGIEAVNEGRVLIMPNKEWEWKDVGNKRFAILALKVRNDDIESQVKELKEEIINLGNGITNVSEKVNNLQEIIKKIEEKDNLRHRIDLVRIEEGSEELEKLLEEKTVEEKDFIIGFNAQEDTQQYQAQIEINLYQK